VETQTNLVSKVVDLTHPIQAMTRDFREIEFDRYTVVNGS
jgi:hypothetical protein